jgi:cell division protein FtsQ
MVFKLNKYRFKKGQLRRYLIPALRFLFVCLGLVALSSLFIEGYHTLLDSPLLRVTNIHVGGSQRLKPITVIKQAAIPAGVNILSLDLKAVSQRVSGHPWVASAVVSREIPDRIRIEIKEREPVALVRAESFLLTDIQGLCFSRAVPGEHKGLPVITGLDPDRVTLGQALPQALVANLQNLYRECGRQMPWRLISEIRWDRKSGLSIFTLQGGIRIVLGNGDYGPRLARLERVLRYLETIQAHSQLRGIDLSYRDRVFVRGSFQVLGQDRPQGRGV